MLTSCWQPPYKINIWLVPSPSNWWGDWGTKRLRDLLQVAQLVGSRDRVKSQCGWVPRACHLLWSSWRPVPGTTVQTSLRTSGLCPEGPKSRSTALIWPGPLTPACGFSPAHPLVIEMTLSFLNSCSLKCDRWTNNVPITFEFVRNSGLHSDLLKQKLCFNRIPRWFTCTWEAERHWLITKKITPTRSPLILLLQKQEKRAGEKTARRHSPLPRRPVCWLR